MIGTFSRDLAEVNLFLLDREFLEGLGLGRPEAFLFLLLFEILVLLLFGEFSGVVSASFKKGLLLNTFFGSSGLVAGGLGALDFFNDDFLSLDLGVTAVVGPAVEVVWTGEGIFV